MSASVIGPIARPDDIRFADALPEDPQRKNHAPAAQAGRTGGAITGDTTTLEDFTVLAKLRHSEE